VRPSLELVCAPHGVQGRLARLEAEMVRIVQTQPAASLLELVRRKALQRRLGGHWHEDRERYRAMGKMERRSACFRYLPVKLDVDGWLQHTRDKTNATLS
jgi:hypothetical protein